jgi:hypothetical protein
LISILPPSIACFARLRVLKKRAAHNHTSTRTESGLAGDPVTACFRQPSAISRVRRATDRPDPAWRYREWLHVRPR